MRKQTRLLMIVLISTSIVFGLMGVGVLFIHKVDTATFQNQTRMIKAELGPIPKTLPYHQQMFTNTLDLLRKCRKDDFDAGQMGPQSSVRAFFYRLGFTKLRVREKERMELAEHCTSLLRSMSNEDFGFDVDQWMKWQRAKEAD